MVRLFSVMSKFVASFWYQMKVNFIFSIATIWFAWKAQTLAPDRCGTLLERWTERCGWKYCIRTVKLTSKIKFYIFTSNYTFSVKFAPFWRSVQKFPKKDTNHTHEKVKKRYNFLTKGLFGGPSTIFLLSSSSSIDWYGGSLLGVPGSLWVHLGGVPGGPFLR